MKIEKIMNFYEFFLFLCDFVLVFVIRKAFCVFIYVFQFYVINVSINAL